MLPCFLFILTLFQDFSFAFQSKDIKMMKKLVLSRQDFWTYSYKYGIVRPAQSDLEN